VSIVVGVDGSSGSKAALRWALAEARLRQTRVEAVYAWSLPYPAIGSVWAPGVDEETLASLHERAEQLLDQTVSAVADEAAEVEVTRSAIEGPAGAVLVEKSEGAELLVVGSRGLGGFRELLLGSVSHQCAQHAHCPVVIIRQPKST
jgi:nucleotide-binding universal stress UspA family protein